MAKTRSRPFNTAEVIGIDGLFKNLHHNTGAAIDFRVFKNLHDGLMAKKKWYEAFGPNCEVVVGPWHDDDAGVLKITHANGAVTYDVIKMESHCSPSSVTPFDSAATGVGGACRDVIAMGGVPLYITDFLGVMPLDREIIVGPCALNPKAVDADRNKVCVCGKCRVMTSAARTNEMVRGMEAMCKAWDLSVAAGGFSASFKDGLVPAVVVTVRGELISAKPLMKAVQKPGNKIIVIGATGMDGNDTVHRTQGIAMIPAKALFEEEIISAKGAVAAVRSGFVVSMADFGAAGVAAAISEGVRKGGLGAEIDLGLLPMMSGADEITSLGKLYNETQARYRIEVEPQNVEEVLARIADTGAIANVVGEITDGRETVYRDCGEEIAVLPNEPTDEDMREVAEAVAAMT
ncbi:AIR synthase-related protein [Candidatus Saccharibacteria bacterium]|nr:AIR synthase-related protein [Candidatus Saccharibacteria bacterium]